MSRTIYIALISLLLVSALLIGVTRSQNTSEIYCDPLRTFESPATCEATHNVGDVVLSVSNSGTFHGAEFPKGSKKYYLYEGAIWVGAVVNRDTLVSVGAGGGFGGREFFPDISPQGQIEFRSTIDPVKPWYVGAVSEQDYIARYFDTCTYNCPGLTYDELDHRSHRPLDIEVTQRSYAWSYPYTKDFVLFDLNIRNIGLRSLHKVYIGIHVDADVSGPYDKVGSRNDICGFYRAGTGKYHPDDLCEYEDTVNVAWVADAKGWFDDIFGHTMLPIQDVAATRIVRSPDPDIDVSFNWWSGSFSDPRLDFGPQLKSHFRDFETGGSGFPRGDRNKYWMMGNREFDYDQVYAAMDPLVATLWTTPDQHVAADIADGYDTYYLLSFGPFGIEPGQSLPLTFAYVLGPNLHHNPDNALNLPDRPDEYYDNLNFSDLVKNSRMADWVYDNPGVDTDSDGYAGKFHVCRTGDSTLEQVDTIYNADSSQIVFIDSIYAFDHDDTIWYKGDEVPDFRAASPPPHPDIRTIMATGKIVVRFNGWRSETARDFFTHKVDFEGYRVYLGRDDRWESYSLLDSYDNENYDKFVWDTAAGYPGEFVLKDDPFTMQELQCLYAPAHCADTSWNPLAYFRSHPYRSVDWPESIFYFTKHDFNRSQPGVNTKITKLYPDAPFPKSLNKDSCLASDTTDEGYFKHFEYEYTIDNLLPTVPYYISVTTFDFGAQNLGMPPMESARTENPIHTYAEESSDSAVAKGLKVTVYPNPYRIDGGYARLGYEGAGPGERDRPSDRNRRIHFYNLPAQCTIKIFSLDGDLVREIDHDFSSADPMSNHDTWDLITRNTQLAVSGLYYWTVESRDGQVQIGKLVIIM